MLLPLLLVMVAGVAASPDPITIMANLPGSAADYPKLPPDLAKAEPIPSTNEYFWIESACSFDKSVIDRLKFANKAAFYEAAYKDAVDIADQAGQWPQYHTEASDLYFKKGLQDLNEGKFKDEIATNLKRASKWNSKRAWFDDYIVLMCTDWDNKCNRPDADDPNGRNIGRYINHTTSWFWTQSKITCCPPFFTLRDLDEIHDLYKDKPKEEIQNEKMEFFMSSGSAMLHEMMHTTAITQFQEKNGRRNVIDRNMPVGRARVYGPRLVSKVAGDNRELRLTPEETTTNADSYAVFASSIHAKNTYALNHIPGPYGNIATIPDDSQDNDSPYGNMTFDSSTNYIIETLPPTQLQMAKTPTPTCDGTPSTRPPVKQGFGQEKISLFCAKVDNTVITSTTNSYLPMAYGIDGKKDAGLLWLALSWDPACHPTAPGKTTVSKDDCITRMSTVLNGCNTDSIDKKWGGQAEGGCVLWNMTTTADNSSTPPKSRAQATRAKRAWSLYLF